VGFGRSRPASGRGRVLAWVFDVMVINTNMAAQQSARLLAQSSARLTASLARLSSGSKIVSPSDDPAGLAVSTRFDAQIHRISAVRSVINNWTSYFQTQYGYARQVLRTLDRMDELILQAKDETKTDRDRALYDQEFQSLSKFLDDMRGRDYNGLPICEGASYIHSVTEVPVDADGRTASLQYDFVCAIGDLYGFGYNVSTLADADNAVTGVDYVRNAMLECTLPNITKNLTCLNRTAEQLALVRDNLSAANSRIQDVDVAEESTRYAREQILVQAGTAMLAQANQSPAAVLRLLQ
jgi:flagellin